MLQSTFWIEGLHIPTPPGAQKPLVPQDTRTRLTVCPTCRLWRACSSRWGKRQRRRQESRARPLAGGGGGGGRGGAVPARAGGVCAPPPPRHQRAARARVYVPRGAAYVSSQMATLWRYWGSEFRRRFYPSGRLRAVGKRRRRRRGGEIGLG